MFGSKKGLSSRHSNPIADHLHKAHKIAQQIFHHINDSLIVLEEVGLEGADQEIQALERYAKHIQQVRESEQKLNLTDKKALKLKQEELSLEGNLVRLLSKVSQLPSQPSDPKRDRNAEQLIASIQHIIDRLKKVLPEEEQALQDAA